MFVLQSHAIVKLLWWRHSRKSADGVDKDIHWVWALLNISWIYPVLDNTWQDTSEVSTQFLLILLMLNWFFWKWNTFAFFIISWHWDECRYLGFFLVEHYSGIIMSSIASQITSLVIVHSTVYSGTDQRKHQSSPPLAFVRGIHRWQMNSPHKGPVTRKLFLFDDLLSWRLNAMASDGLVTEGVASAAIVLI